MIIKVKGYLTYKDIIRQNEIELREDVPVTLREFLRVLATKIGGEHGHALFNGETGAIGRSVAVMHNGRHYNHLPDKLDTILNDQDEIGVFPPGAGG